MGQHIASLEWNDVRTSGLLRPRAALPALQASGDHTIILSTTKPPEERNKQVWVCVCVCVCVCGPFP
jgi:hypothetical protein